MDITINTRQAYSEIDEFLELLDDKHRDKVPKKLREFFKNEIGNSFKYNVKFQKWLKVNPDKTYRDAIDA